MSEPFVPNALRRRATDVCSAFTPPPTFLGPKGLDQLIDRYGPVGVEQEKRQ